MIFGKGLKNSTLMSVQQGGLLTSPTALAMAAMVAGRPSIMKGIPDNYL